jgi:adenylate kinase
MLAQQFSILHISTGDLLREAVATGTELGRKAQGFMDSGELVPDDLVIDLIEETLRTNEGEKGFILDGFPRTLNQAKALNELLTGMEMGIHFVIYLDVSSDEVVRRLSLRRSCPSCNRLYNMASEPPADGVHCDECGDELIVRKDDREDVILNRLEVYQKETFPILDWYERESTVVKVNGELSPSEVLGEITRFIENSA